MSVVSVHEGDTTMTKYLLALTVLPLTLGCTRVEHVSIPVTDKPTEQGAAIVPGISVTPATSQQCVAGGVVYEIFVDENRNGAREVSETITSEQIICSGVNGTNGSSGANGHSVVFQTVAAPLDVCTAGGTTIVMAIDVTDIGHYVVDLPNQQSMTLCNGTNGADGANGTNGTNAPLPSYSPADAIQPCGDRAYGEVLLRLHNGQVLASLSNDTGGTMTRLSFITDGTYMTTDTQSCQFSLATNGSTRSISWFGQVQLTWAIP
jgi:hypothetical protein